jgi:hypothetical protein
MSRSRNIIVSLAATLLLASGCAPVYGGMFGAGTNRNVSAVTYGTNYAGAIYSGTSLVWSAESPWTNGVLHPIMTANNAPSPYVVAGNKEYSAAFVAWKAFDGTYLSGWDNYSSPASNSWIWIDLGTSKTATSYTLTRYGGYPAYAPKAWQFQGGSSMSAWTTLDTRTGYVTASWPATGLVFTVASPASYRYYRINVTEQNTANEVGLGEIVITGRIYQ